MEKLKRLDIVLRHLDKIIQPDTYRDNYELKNELNKKGYNFSDTELWLITNKLFKDGYITTLEDKQNYFDAKHPEGYERKVHKFFITYEGKCFEGYENEKIILNNDSNKARRNEWLISRGAALAAIFSGLLLLMEILKYCSEKNNTTNYYYSIF